MTRYPLLYLALAIMLYVVVFGAPAEAARLAISGSGAAPLAIPSVARGSVDLLAAGATAAMLNVPCQVDALLGACTLGSAAASAQFLANDRSYVRNTTLTALPAMPEYRAGDLYVPATILAAELARLSGNTITYANQTLTVTPAGGSQRVVAPPQPPVTPPRTPANDSRYSLRKIVIDAGHGGQDPGAVGNALNEKDINLALALRTQNALRERLPGVQVILTRSDDRFISLGGRPKIANDANADMFISIHCNASVNTSANGFEVYVLSADNTDNNSRTLAAMENSAQFESEENRRQYSSTTLTVLERMRLTEYQQESVELAGFIKKQVVPRLGVDDRGVKSANFAVLRG
ncbi:MAG TPA: N-acetylmuramoyl-L-alanine amidase, partial [bacterium]|nr:N-acetylmuramoyl-L-alanine amidase [bacterium]